MIFELLHSSYPDGYGESLLSLEACKEHLKVDGEDEDFLIKALRDASIQVIELYCGIKLRSTPGLEWRAACFPHRSMMALPLCVSPVTQIEAISWRDAAGDKVAGAPDAYRLSSRGDILPAYGAGWPVGAAGEVSVIFTAGYPADQAPPALLAAVRLFLGHLYKNREAVTDRGTEAEIPFGVRQICAPFCRILI